MKVAFLALAPFISGSERSMQMILSNCHHESITAILIAPKNSPIHKWALDNGIKNYQCPLEYTSILKHPVKWLNTQIRLFVILLKERVEVVHSNQLWSYPVVAKVAKLLGIKRVCHFRDEVNEGCNWWLSSGLDLGICISSHIEKQLRKSVNTDIIKDIAMLINPVKVGNTVSENKRLALRKKSREINHLSDHKVVFGYIGQIAPVKGITEMLNVLAEMKNTDWYFILAGDDPSPGKSYLKQCKDLINKLNLVDRVRFLGFIDDVDTFYHSVDVVLVFSKQEPLGRIPLEAGACYTPCIATAIGGLPETISDGETGWLLSPDTTVGEKAKALDAIIDLDLISFGIAARKLVEKIAEPKAYVKQLYKLYNS